MFRSRLCLQYPVLTRSLQYIFRSIRFSLDDCGRGWCGGRGDRILLNRKRFSIHYVSLIHGALPTVPSERGMLTRNSGLLPDHRGCYTGKDRSPMLQSLCNVISPLFYIFSDRRRPSAELSPKCRPKGNLNSAVRSHLTDPFSMLLPLEVVVCLSFSLGLTYGLPIPVDSNRNLAPFGAFPLVYSRRGLPISGDRSSATEYSPVDRPQVWGGTPANTSICSYPALWTGWLWWIMGVISLLLLAFYGLATIVMMGIMTVDLPRLMVWNRTGDEKRR